ncbi:MAG: hypothetical protein HDS14_00380 [Bacteroides sp.]|nr:hypothetical protein [Bacteroides sp.]
MKQKHPDAIILLRVGDFYETFYQDAIDCSEILNITLTRRNHRDTKPMEMARFPHHALDTYLPKLIRAGRRVAICETPDTLADIIHQVKQEVTELVTPGFESDTKNSHCTQGELEANPKPRKVLKYACTQAELDTIGEYGEPDARFSVKIPSYASGLKEIVHRCNLAHLRYICIRPEKNLIFASDGRELTEISVQCSGLYTLRVTNNYNHLEGYIRPEVIRHLAGRQVYISVWNRDDAKVTFCETDGFCCICENVDRYPDIDRITRPGGPIVSLSPESLELFEDFVGRSVDVKPKDELKNTYMRFTTSPTNKEINVTIYRENSLGHIESSENISLSLQACKDQLPEFCASINLNRIARIIRNKFTGQITLPDPEKKMPPMLSFKQERMTSLLMGIRRAGDNVK